MMFRASYIPNLICVARIVLVFPIVFSLLSGDFITALVLIFLAGFSDGLDGYLAKHFQWRTRLGGILDPLADKLLLVSVIMTLTWLGLSPVWLACVVIGRDLIIVTGGTVYNFLIGPVEPDPSLISKLNTGLQLLYMLFVISRQAFGWPESISILVIGAGVFVTSVISGLDYVLRWSVKAIAAGRD
jgi:cardiolipin synthase